MVRSWTYVKLSVQGGVAVGAIIVGTMIDPGFDDVPGVAVAEAGPVKGGGATAVGGMKNVGVWLGSQAVAMSPRQTTHVGQKSL